MRISSLLLGFVILSTLSGVFVLGNDTFPRKVIQFRRPVTITLSDGQAVISFGLNQPTDVKVAILNNQGQIVRHLAAGVLGGKNPPPAPLTAKLSQEISWDGTDDLRKPAVGFPMDTVSMAIIFQRIARLFGIVCRVPIDVSVGVRLIQDIPHRLTVMSGRIGHALAAKAKATLLGLPSSLNFNKD